MMANRLDVMQRIGDGTALFLFNLTTREITGTFVRNGPAGMNLEPDAWSSCPHSKNVERRRCRCQFTGSGSAYPAQIRFKIAPAPYQRSLPVPEHEWAHILTAIPNQKTKSGKPHYDVWLSARQAKELASACGRKSRG